MITGALKSKVDSIWNTMWSGGISNPLSVIEQLTYLLFIKRLDELHTLKERKAARTGKPIEDPIFTAKQDKLRWSRFKEAAPEQMFETVRDGVFSFMKTLGQKGEADGEGGSTYSHHMEDALFMMPTARVLANVVDQLDGIDMADSDTKGDLYEYMLGKIATAGQNGQFRTPRHIIRLMVDMTAPTPKDVICDPACGTAGFLVAASEHLVEHHSDTIYKDAAARRHFNEGTFHGYDFDNTMLRIGSMNMLLHGVENPDIRYKDSLAQTDDDDAEKYSLVLANPPFAGSLDYESTAKDLQQVVKTKKTELLFLALFLRLLQPGGRAAVIVPDGVLFGSSKAHRTLRTILVEEQKLDAIVSMPSGVFKPYAGVSTAILLFTKTNSGGTDHVWFYDMQADGYSLDDKRTPQPGKSDLADILARWQDRKAEAKRTRTDQSFLVPKAEIAGNDYDLSINRYKEVEYEAVEYDPPTVILERLAELEAEIAERDVRSWRGCWDENWPFASSARPFCEVVPMQAASGKLRSLGLESCRGSPSVSFVKGRDPSRYPRSTWITIGAGLKTADRRCYSEEPLILPRLKTASVQGAGNPIAALRYSDQQVLLELQATRRFTSSSTSWITIAPTLFCSHLKTHRLCYRLEHYCATRAETFKKVSKLRAPFKIPDPPPAPRRAEADCGDSGCGGRLAGQAPRGPRPARHPPPIHLPRHVRRSRHQSDAVGGP